jgi:hypothetical protein
LEVLAIEDAKAMEGISYSIRKRYSIESSGSMDLILDPTAFTGQAVVFQPVSIDAIGGPFHVDIYRGATADDDGTLINPFNRDLNILTNGQVLLRKDPGNVVPGTDKPIELLIPSNGTGTVGVSGASSGDAIVAKLDITKKYLIRITNTDTVTAGQVGIKADHFEVP